MRIELSSHFAGELVHDLLAGSLDLAMVTEPPSSPLLSMVKIGETPLYVTLSPKDALARQGFVRMEDLIERDWILFERQVHPLLYDAILRLAQERGVSPSAIHHVMTPEEAFPFISQGNAIAFHSKTSALRSTKFTSPQLPREATMRPLREEALTLKTYLASRADNSSKLASELLRAFMRKLAQFTDVHEVRQLPLPIHN